MKDGDALAIARACGSPITKDHGEDGMWCNRLQHKYLINRTGNVSNFKKGTIFSSTCKGIEDSGHLLRGCKASISVSEKIFIGLTMVWKCGYKNVIVETDSGSAVQLLNYGTDSNHSLFSLTQSCRDIMNADWSCSVKHVYREGNALTDGFAYLGHKMDIGL
ncbi:hypothetical protein Ddye_021613 [Dipteronia dyeriana]|uniref:RNase H type-1 domain-containing protein n=1 Tax=Dipteronia dyeriana TaxID=168575 RepID=A0AAD9U2R0_9ROSI|nr:hypothetical protein Ddye_021613 [Dipteronia dyeriana]